MKKILFLSLMGMTLAACSNEDLPFEETAKTTTEAQQAIISAEEAAEIATEAFNAFTENGAKSRAAVSMSRRCLLWDARVRVPKVSTPIHCCML